MARKEYFSPEEKTLFDNPPPLNPSQQLIFLEIPQWAEEYAASLYTSSTRLGFLLQLGYFRIVTRFFIPIKFNAADIDFIARNRMDIKREEIELTSYAESGTYYRHQKEILAGLGFIAFSKEHQSLLKEEATRLTYLQVRPSTILDTCVNYLKERRIEIPTYNLFRSILTEVFDRFELSLQAVLDKYLAESDRQLLEELLDKK